MASFHSQITVYFLIHFTTICNKPRGGIKESRNID